MPRHGRRRARRRRADRDSRLPATAGVRPRRRSSGSASRSIVVTAVAGGGQVGFLLGLLFLAARRRAALPQPAAAVSLASRRWPASSRPAPRARRALALLGRLRRDRLVDLLRARDHRPARASASRRSCCSASACSSCSSRSRTPRRRSALPETGGAATFVRRAVERPRRVHDRLGALPRLPDRDRALGALRAALPRRRAPGQRARPQPVGRDRRRRARSSASGDPARRAGLALRDRLRRPRARRARRSSCWSCFGFVLLFSPHALTHGTLARHAPTWHSLAFAIPLAMLAFTGLETVANLAEEARRPGVDLPRSLFARDRHGRHRLRRDRRRRALRVPGPGHRARHPLAPRAARRRRRGRSAATRRTALGDAIRFFVGVSGALILLASVDDVDLRLLAARLLARRARPAAARVRPAPPADARLAAGDRQRVGRSRAAIVIAIVVHQARRRVPRERLLVRRPARVHGDAARRDQAARSPSPTCRGPTATPLNVTIRGAEIPLPAIVGAVLTFAVWIVALGDASGRALRRARLARDRARRLRRRAPLARRGPDRARRSRPTRCSFADVPHFRRILVPMKLGVIGEEMAATAVKLAAEHGARGRGALRRSRVPLDLPLDAPMPDAEARAEASLAGGVRARRGARRRGRGDDDPRPRDRARDRRPRARRAAPT